MHKISREKLIDDKLQFDKHRNGKVLIDEIPSQLDNPEKLDESTDDADDDEDDMEAVLSVLDEVQGSEFEWNTTCTTDDGKSKFCKMSVQ